MRIIHNMVPAPHNCIPQAAFLAAAGCGILQDVFPVVAGFGTRWPYIAPSLFIGVLCQ